MPETYGTPLTNVSDAARVHYTPASSADWSQLAVPAYTAPALDQLAARISSVENGNLRSGSAESGTVPVADGEGGTTWQDIAPVVTAWKSQRVEAVTLESADTWTDIVWDLKLPDECLPGVAYYDEGGVYENASILVVNGFEGLLHCDASIHLSWGGSADSVVGTAIRLIYSADDGSAWTEARGLSSVSVRSRCVNDVETLTLSGALAVQQGTWLKLQVRATDTDMTLEGWPDFDCPVAATITLTSVADYTIAFY